jgi:predicted RNA-binding Zn-ribbon protein involved in translation (DUF1610 family)
MRDIELYRAILGLPAPWTVASVDLDVKGQQVVVRVEPGPGPFPCPECGRSVPRYDSKPRRWRHLDTCQFTTWSPGLSQPGAFQDRHLLPLWGTRSLPTRNPVEP